MTEETKTPKPEEQPVEAAGVVVADEAGNVQAAAEIAVQGRDAVLVAQFADMDAARMAYEALRDAEAKRAIDIHGVLVVNADYQGKIHIQKMTDHTTRNGFLWGAAAGAIIGVIFPPTILASAATVGIAGAITGKAGNELKKGKVAEELASVITPGTSGIVAVVAITAVDAVKQSIPEAKAVKTAPVSDETSDALAAAAKASGDQSAAAQPAS